MLRVSRYVLASLLGVFVLGRVAAAQCPLPDQLDGGPCCTVATPKLPNFPKFTHDALEICWRDCAVSQVINYRAVWSNVNIQQPSGPPCGERMVRLDLYDTAGILQWTGNLRQQYSRTWAETDPGGFPLQVWRFLVNGDMQPVSATALIPCPVPACAPAHNNRVRFTGYVDYARNCAVLPAFYQQAWMLTHACDFIDHHAGFPRAGAFHPDRSYSFVGPAAGFVPAPITPLEGTPGSGFEAMRRRNLTPLGTVAPATCDFEERINFNLLPQQQLCLCGPAAAPAQFLIANLSIFGSCGSSVTSPGFPYLPGFISMGIGTWTIAATFPGVERVRWNAGGYDWTDGCTGALRQEVYYGATTIGGFPAFQITSGGPVAPLPLTFIDQGDSQRAPYGGTVMNIPFISDHILNLNH